MDDLVRDARSLRLNASEREQTRLVIAEFIAQHPPQDASVTPAAPWTLWSLKPVAAFVLALVVVIGIGRQSDPSPVREKVVERVQQAKDQLGVGAQKFDEQDDRQAIISFRDAQRSALEAEELINAQRKLSAISPMGPMDIKQQQDAKKTVRVKVKTDQERYRVGERMIVTVTATNPSDHLIELKIPSGCPATIMVDNQEPSVLVCPEEVSTIFINAGDSHSWVFHLGVPEGVGGHSVMGFVVGYGSDEIQIRVTADFSVDLSPLTAPTR